MSNEWQDHPIFNPALADAELAAVQRQLAAASQTVYDAPPGVAADQGDDPEWEQYMKDKADPYDQAWGHDR